MEFSGIEGSAVTCDDIEFSCGIEVICDGIEFS